MSTFDVLVPKPLMPAILAGAAAHARLHKLWEAADPAAALAAVAPSIRGILSGGVQHNPIDAALIAQLPRLEIIAHLGVGYDQIDVGAARAKNVIVTHTPDVLTDEVADLAMGLLLATVRRLPQADAFLRAEKWPGGTFPLTASLRGRTLGILGLGRIGRAIARRAEGFGLRIAYHGRTAQADVAYAYHPTAQALAAASDILMVVAPGGPATTGLVDAAVLAALGPDGILINVARGSIVDEPALIAALQDGTIHAAGLDVFAREPHVPAALRALDNVVLLPHVGSGSHATRAAMAQLVVDNLVGWIGGRGPLTPVAETPWPGAKFDTE